MFNIFKRKTSKKEPVKYHRIVLKCIDCGEEIIAITQGVQCKSKINNSKKDKK